MLCVLLIWACTKFRSDQYDSLEDAGSPGTSVVTVQKSAKVLNPEHTMGPIRIARSMFKKTP